MTPVIFICLIKSMDILTNVPIKNRGLMQIKDKLTNDGI